MLKTSCDAFRRPSESSFFDTYYQPVRELPDDVTKEVFLDTLTNCDMLIPNGNSMGEKKSFVLAQLLQLRYPGKVVVLCSDDGKARQRAIYIGNQIKCLSILSIFQKLKTDGLEKKMAWQYYHTYCQYLADHHQNTLKVWTHSTSEKISVDFETLFQDLYDNQFEIKGTGDLRYLR